MQIASNGQIQFKNFQFKIISPDAIQMQLRGNEGIKRHKILLISNVEAYRKGEKIVAKKAKYNEAVLQLRGNVNYTNKGFRFFSQKVNYFLEKKIVQVPDIFELQSESLQVKGSKLLYNQKLGKIVAYDIEAKIES